VATSSGDTIAAVQLEESDTHSGVFEGAVQTASGQAVAVASDSEDGKEPNFVISKGNYPAWVALPDNQRPKSFSIDLNDNVALGKMKMVANVAGRKLKKFLLATSLNGKDFTTVGQWPGEFTPWDGSLEMELVKFGNESRGPSTAADFKQYLEEGYIKENTPKYAVKPRMFGARLDSSVGGYADRMQLAGEREGSWYIAHFRAAFYQPVRRIRAFEVDTKSREENIRYLLLIDGQGGETATQVRRSLGKGVHVVDLYLTATRKAEPHFDLMIDTDAPPFMKPVPLDMFDPKKHPQIKAGVHVEPAKIVSSAEDTTFDIAFAEASRARVIRFLLTDFETDAPAINKITLQNKDGETVLPTKEDFMALRKNQVLEIVPGDRITITYQDPKVITEGRDHHEAFLTATFSNAEVSACFVEYSVDSAGERRARYISMRRFKPGDKINVFINDPDHDISDKQDTIKFAARTSEGKPVELPALETEEHSGVFLGGLFPVDGDPKRESELKVVEGDDVILTYVDQENTDPGIPWNRTCIVEQTWYEPPEARIYEVTSRPLTDEEQATVAAADQDAESQLEESVPVTRSMVATWPEQPEPEKPTQVMIHGPLIVELLFPYIAQSPESTASIFVQTSSGRKALGEPPKGEFDVRVPGTLKLQTRPSNAPSVEAPPGYKSLLVRTNPYAADALDDGRFTFLVPYELGKLPKTSYALQELEEGEEKPVLAIRGNDEIFIGLQYQDDKGDTHWSTRKVVLEADSFFDLMDRRYRELLEGAYMGENAYFRVIDPKRDASDEKDAITVALKTTSGTTKDLQLTETFTHSGVFKGLVKLVYRGDEEAAKAPNALPVNYGDMVTALYKRADEEKGLERTLVVFKGSDGEVVPFTKRFKDPEIAVQTQFSIAEAYFELAKRHRELGQESLARREIAQGKKLLEEAIRDYPDTEARAQADYLLAELSLEFGNDAKDEEVKKEFYMEAVSRFSDIVATYPDSPYAPKSQYKKALVFEKMGLIDQACEEYVKLSYRYPDNELVAETIARLGQYFLTKGKDIRKTAAEQGDAVEREKGEMKARDMYKTAGQVFGRLAVRFPTHRLAGKTSVLSAQCYMQAEDLPKAIEVFKSIAANEKMDKDLIAESMYWCGDCYMKQSDYVNAYRMFKRLTWDYPASKWAKFARGRLTEESLVSVGERDTE
jgi:TolA-binding protein